MNSLGKRVFLSLCALCISIPLYASDRHEGSYLRDVTMAWKTKHLEWAPRLAGGPIKTFFITPRRIAAREIVELAERLNLDFTAFVTPDVALLSRDDIYDGAVEGTSRMEKTKEILGKLRGKRYDLIVIGNFVFSKLPSEAKYLILKMVSEGTGLVMIYPRTPPYKELTERPVPGAAAILALANPFALPEKASKVKPKELLRTYTFGKGRVALIDYRFNHSAGYGGLAITCPQYYTREWYFRYENNMALASRSMMWAARRLGPMRITPDSLNPLKPISQNKLPSEFTFKLENAAKCELKLRLRDQFNQVIKTWKTEISKNQKSVKVALPFLTSGLYCVDIIASTPKGVVDLGYAPFEVSTSLAGPALTIDKEAHNNGEPIFAKFAMEKPASEKLALELSIADSPYGRIWFKKTYSLPAGATSAGFEIHPPTIPTLAAYLRCRVVGSKGILTYLEKALFFPQKSREIFPTIGWDSIPPNYLSPIIAERMVESVGWYNGLSHPWKDGENARVAALMNQHFMPYTTRVMLGADNKAPKEKQNWTIQERWFFLPREAKSKVKKLDMDESIYNPDAKALWREGMRYRVKNLAKYSPLVYSLGDENHFSYKTGFSPTENMQFTWFLKKRYGSLEHLNSEWNSKYAKWSDVEHLSEADARKAGNFAAWNDHRIFMEHQYADVHHFAAKCIKEVDPLAKVGAEGSPPGDLEYTLNGLEFWGPYSNFVMNEVLRSLGRDKLRTLWWGGYVGSHGGRNGFPMPLWRPLLLGTVNGSAWFSTGCSSEGMYGTDMSLAKYFKEMFPYLKELQNGLGQMLVVNPLMDDGVAILWDHASLSAATMDDRFFSPKDGSSALLRVCYANGLSAQYLSSAKLTPESLSKYKILFLFGDSSMSSENAKIISDFCAAGGVVVADVNPAVLDEFCKPLPKSRLSDLFGVPALTAGEKPTQKSIAIKKEVNGVTLSLIAKSVKTNPAFGNMTIRKVGKGSATLLNFNLASAASTAKSPDEFDRFVLDLMAVAGVKPLVKVSGLNKSQTVVRIRQGEGFEILGLLAPVDDMGKTAKIALPEKRHVYIPLKGYAGFTNVIERKLTSPFLLRTLFKNKQNPPVIVLNKKTVTLGGSVQLDLSSYGKNRVLRLTLLDSDGKRMNHRPWVIAVDPKKPVREIRFAYNYPAGKYTLKMVDVQTGLSSTASIDLK